MPSNKGKDIICSVEIPINWGPPDGPDDADCKCSKNPYCADELSKEAQERRAKLLAEEGKKFGEALGLLRKMKDGGLLCCSELARLEQFERFHTGLKQPG